jgi:hypothetical protein
MGERTWHTHQEDVSDCFTFLPGAIYPLTCRTYVCYIQFSEQCKSRRKTASLSAFDRICKVHEPWSVPEAAGPGRVEGRSPLSSPAAR